MKSRQLTCITAIIVFVALAVPIQLAAQQSRYKLIDIGTFGGPSSTVPGPSVVIVSNRGAIVGAADTPTSDSPDCFFDDCFIQHGFTWQKGVMTDLGALPGGNSSFPNWISETGWIVGVSENGQIDPLAGVPEIDAVVWKDGQIINLGTLGGNQSFGFSINNRGQAVGLAQNAIPDPFSLFGLGTQSRAFLWQNGVMQDLGTLGGPDAIAGSLNEAGQVDGASYTNSTPNPITLVPTLDPFFWENGRMIDLGTLGGTFGSSTFMNDRGQVIGTSNLSGDLAFHPFLWDHGVLSDLGTLGGNNGTPLWINNAGEVVGEADLPSGAPDVHHGFLWRKGVMTDLGTLGSTSHATTINSKGQIVGRSRIGPANSSLQHAFLWENGGPIIDLNTLIPPNSPLLLTDAEYINDRGEIAGSGLDVNGNLHAYLLIPCGQGIQGCGAAAQGTTATRDGLVPTLKPSMKPEVPRTINELIAGWRARMAERHHVPNLGAPRE